MKFSGLKNKFIQNGIMLKLMDLEHGLSLKNDFSRRHLCQNPPALAGGRLKG